MARVKKPNNCTQLAEPHCAFDCEGCGFDIRELTRRKQMIPDGFVYRDGKYFLIVEENHEQGNPDWQADEGS